MRRVILESPYNGDIDGNVTYARACVRDSLLRGEAPIASHLTYTQPGILCDVAAERELGITAGLAWGPVADATVVYLDRGISPGIGTRHRQCGKRRSAGRVPIARWIDVVMV